MAPPLPAGRPGSVPVLWPVVFSQYVVTRASNAVVVDPEVDLTLLGPLGCGIQTGSGTVLNRLKPVVGESLVVFGCGAVGLSAIMAAKLTGCSHYRGGYPCQPPRLGGRTGRHPSDQRQEQDAVAVIKQITGKGAHYAVERPASPLSFCRPYTR